MLYSTDNSIIAAKGVGLLYGVGLMLGSMCITLITQFLTLEYEEEHDAGMMVAITTVGSVLGSSTTPSTLLPYIGLMSSLAAVYHRLSRGAWLCTNLAYRR